VPNLFVIAGPNGAGKSTIAGKLLVGNRRVEEFVNADVIAARIQPTQGNSADLLAGRIMLKRIQTLVSNKFDLGFETTLSSRTLLSRIAEMRDAGYLFHLIYLWLPSAEMAIQRVAARVRDGGHFIPDKVVQRRFHRSLVNFFNRYRPIADSWAMLDNSGSPEPRLIAWRNVGGPVQWERDGPWERLRSEYETDPFG
jgi:predicted ABC-type ATPase